MLSCIALWAHDVEIDGIYYNLSYNNTATVTYKGTYYNDYNEYSGIVTIPETITYHLKNYSVTKISSEAFRDCSSLTSVTIPNSVTYIDDYAFSGCSGLTSITIPNSVTEIGEEAFSGCSGLISITIPNSVTKIESSAFDGCSELTSIVWNAKENEYYISSSSAPFYNIRSQITSFTFGNEVERISAYLCYGMNNLKTITIPNSVTEIGKEAFSGCSELTKVTIPNSVTKIGEEAFYNTGIYNNESNWDNGVLYIDNCLISANSEIVNGAYAIPNTTTTIAPKAFFDCNNITSITIPINIKSVGSMAFQDCDALTSVIWNAKNCADIGRGDYEYSPFYNSPVESFVFGEEVEYIPGKLCDDLYNLKEIIIPNSVITIGMNAFSDSSIEKVTFGSGVTTIGTWSFAACNALTSIIIPDNVTIGDGAFRDCKSLEEIILGEGITFTDGTAFYGCDALISQISKNYIWKRASSTDGWSLIIGDEVTQIPSQFCFRKLDLTMVTIGKSVKTIGHDAFYECHNLKVVCNRSSLGISKGSMQYGYVSYYAEVVGKDIVLDQDFVYNKNEEIIAYIGDKTVTSIEIPARAKGISSDFFDGWKNLNKIKVSDDSQYLTCEDGVLFNKDKTNLIKFLTSKNLVSYSIPETVTSISNGAFLDCSSLNSVSIGENVTSIGDDAFKGCSNLNAITIPNNVTSIGSRAFYECTSLNSVSIGENVTSIGDEAFKGCSNLNTITIPYNVTVLGRYAFRGCNNLSLVNWEAKKCADYRCNPDSSICTSPFNYTNEKIEFKFGNKVEYIPAYLCYRMINLTTVTIPNSVTSIGQGAFLECKNITSVIWNAKNCSDFNYSEYWRDYLYPPFYDSRSTITSFTIGDSVEYIPAYMCYEMNNLTSVTLPNSVTSIGKDAFFGCKGLTSIRLEENITKIDYEAFYGCENLKTVRNMSDINITKGSSDNGYIAYYADLVYAYIEDNFLLDKNYIIFDYLGDLNLSSVELPAITKGINPHILSKFTNLTSITIGSDVANLSSDVFSGCNNLKEINVLSENPNYITENGILFNKNKTELIKYPIAKSEDSYSIPETVISISAEAFKDCKNLTSITISNSVSSIGKDAFYGCNNLKSITIPKNISYIGTNAFYGCSGITSVEWNAINCSDFSSTPFAQSPIENFTFGNEVQRIPAYLCSGMSGLDEITIPNTVTTIGAYAFSNCSSFTSVIVPNKVSLIAEGAFNNCSKLTNIILGQNVSMIENYAFTGCRKIREVTSYAEVVPETGYEEIFENYNANLYVPCDALEDYYYDVTFGSFKDNSQCMSAEEVQTGDKVEIEVDDRNNATVTWPSNKNAKKYNLVISKDGEVVCTLYFNRDGRLNSIDFKRSASAEQEGFKFTVTGLEGASRYGYLMSALGEADNVIEEHIGDFTTNGAVDIIETLADANITISNGLITCPETDFAIYNTIGQDVTAFNGSLQPGVYLVSIENDIVKVMIK